MAQGLFASLLIGTIIGTLGKQLGIELATVKRPEETGFDIEKIKEVLMEIK